MNKAAIANATQADVETWCRRYDYKCPVCGSKTFHLNKIAWPTVTCGPEDDMAKVNMNTIVPIHAISCGTCGHTTMISSVALTKNGAN